MPSLSLVFRETNKKGKILKFLDFFKKIEWSEVLKFPNFFLNWTPKNLKFLGTNASKNHQIFWNFKQEIPKIFINLYLKLLKFTENSCYFVKFQISPQEFENFDVNFGLDYFSVFIHFRGYQVNFSSLMYSYVMNLVQVIRLKAQQNILVCLIKKKLIKITNIN